MIKRILMGTCVLAMFLSLTEFSFAQQRPNRARTTTTAARTATAPKKTPTTFENPELVKKYQATITADDLAAHLYFYASDFFQGRETTAWGQKLAIRYLASVYQRLGLTPKGTVQTTDMHDPQRYFQPFKLIETRFKSMSLNATANGQTIASTSFTPGASDGLSYPNATASGSMEGSGGIVFAGYGIADDALKYNDYAALTAANINKTGKWVMILADEPMSDDKTSLLTPDKVLSSWTAQWFKKLTPANGGDQRPLGILVVSDQTPRAKEAFGVTANRQAANMATSVGRLQLPRDGQAAPARPTRNSTPLIYISSAFANKLIASSGKTIEQLKNEINSSLKPTVFEVQGVTMAGKVEQETRDAQSENVAAFMEGTDLKDEVVVISAHLDHVGFNGASGCTPKGDDNICNGADDDGSGTVSVLEMAEAFTKAAADGYRPRRSILFLNVTGEEKGLFGSEYFADKEPLVPVDKIVTNLNIDMVGRIDPTFPDPNDKHYVYIIGSNLISQELHETNIKVNQVTGTKVTLSERFNSKSDPNQFYRRSDHWNFGKHGIPFIFFFTGTHEDYHQVGDEPQKIEYNRMADIVRMVFGTAWQVANQDKRPVVSGTGFN
jgi:hypothetical protein